MSMRKRFFSLLLMMGVILVFVGSSVAKETPKYIVSQIPADLRQNVNAVFWQNNRTFQIHAKNRTTVKVSRVVTIFNENAKHFATAVVQYDKQSKVTSFKGTIYDAHGFVLKKIKPSEIYDQSAYDGEETLFSDDRVKYMNLTNGNYPYTVEYEYEVETRYLFVIFPFTPLHGEKTSCIKAEYKVIYANELKPNFKTENIKTSPVFESTGGGIESVTWQFNNIKTSSREPYDFYSQSQPIVWAAPTQFEHSGYEGRLDSWTNFGLWMKSLNFGRDNLPAATAKKLKSITDQFDTPIEKVMATYEFLQGKTRYVSIQLGIGGYQPFDAASVDRLGYGDCKALSNYMVSLLASIGIRSHYTLIMSSTDERDLDVSFPSSQFNHVVVCVPLATDTVWLECTSQKNPFGYMGSSTANRKALAITETGAAPVRTPVYSEKQNVQKRNANVVLDIQGNGKAEVVTTYSGLMYEYAAAAAFGSVEEQKKWLQLSTDIPVFDLNSFRVAIKKERVPSVTASMNLTLNKLATVTGKRLFLQPNLMNRETNIPAKVESRKSKVILRNTFSQFDSISYSVPEQIYPEFLPEPIKIESRFGTYEATFKLDQGKVVYIRKFVRRNGEFPAESYAELIDFYKNVSRADNTKLIFLNKT